MTSTITEETIEVARQMAQDVDFELRDAERLTLLKNPVPVREIVVAGVVFGYFISQGASDKGEIWASISEVTGDNALWIVEDHIPGDDDSLDAAGREVIANALLRGHDRFAV